MFKEIEDIILRIDKNQYEIEKMIGASVINKDAILTKYLCLITELKDRLSQILKANEDSLMEEKLKLKNSNNFNLDK